MSDLQVSEWERRTGPVFVAAAVAFLGAYAWPILDPELPAWGQLSCRAVTVVVWVTFALDLVVRLFWAESKASFLRRNWMDLATLAVPM
ncbi:MAG TPA: hypothetical protein VFM86_02370, partial [Pedococcus sp.]|nr:hypothetical protein [Pedococcus sp.]